MSFAEKLEFAKGQTKLLVSTDGEDIGTLYYDDGSTAYADTCMTVSEALSSSGALTEAQLQDLWTLTGREEDERAWDYFETLFSRDSALGDMS